MSAKTTIEIPKSGIATSEEEIYDIGELGEGGAVLKSRKTVELTPAFAWDFLTYSELSAGDEKIDRNKGDDWVRHLAREMLAGNFLWEDVLLKTCVCDGITYRINGQHSCWARILASEEGLDKNGPVRCPVAWLRYEASSMADVRQLYAQSDGGKPRSRATQIIAYTCGTDEFPGYAKKTLKLLAQGLNTWKWANEEARSEHTASDLAYLMLKEHNKLALSVGKLLNESTAKEIKHLARAAAVAAMYATYDKAPQMAYEFWSSVRDGVGLDAKDDPRLTLRTYLLTTGLQKSHIAGNDNKTVTQEEMYRACIAAWNAHRAGKHLKQLRVSLTEERPTVR